MRVSKYFLQILAGVTNAQIAADPGGVLSIGAEHRIPFYICEADFGMDLFVLSPAPGLIDFEIEAPDGTRFTPASGSGGMNASFALSRYASYYRCALPVSPADPDTSHAGTWHAVLRLQRRRPGYTVGPAAKSSVGQYVPYEFVAHTYSALTYSVDVFAIQLRAGRYGR